jgi:hypothetical protein
MERQEYIRRLVAAAGVLDDRALSQLVGQAERVAKLSPKESAPVVTGSARIVPFRRVANQ